MGEGIDTLSFPVALDREILPLHIEAPIFEQEELNTDGKEELWLRISPSHFGPLSLALVGSAEQLVVYEVPPTLFLINGAFLENDILNLEVARLLTDQHQAHRVDLIASAEFDLLVRLHAPSANASLTIAQVLELLGTTLVVHHSSPTDQVRTSMQGSPILEVNDFRYDLSSLGVSHLKVPAGATASLTRLQPLVGISQEITINEYSGVAFLLDLVGATPSISDGAIEFTNLSRVIFPDSMTPRLLRIVGWQNLINRFDVNNDGMISPSDALVVINQINRFTTSDLPELLNDSNYPTRYFDTNGDSRITPIDALIIVNYLNRSSAGEREPDSIQVSESINVPTAQTWPASHDVIFSNPVFFGQTDDTHLVNETERKRRYKFQLMRMQNGY